LKSAVGGDSDKVANLHDNLEHSVRQNEPRPIVQEVSMSAAPARTIMISIIHLHKSKLVLIAVYDIPTH
jgi:hypothetical protein